MLGDCPSFGKSPQRPSAKWPDGQTSAGLANPNGVAVGFVVHGFEMHAFLRVFVEKHGLERGVLDRESLSIFEDTIGLDLDTAVLAVAQIGDDLHAAIG